MSRRKAPCRRGVGSKMQARWRVLVGHGRERQASIACWSFLVGPARCVPRPVPEERSRRKIWVRDQLVIAVRSNSRAIAVPEAFAAAGQQRLAKPPKAARTGDPYRRQGSASGAASPPALRKSWNSGGRKKDGGRPCRGSNPAEPPTSYIGLGIGCRHLQTPGIVREICHAPGVVLGL